MEWNDILLVAAALAAILMCVLLIVLLMRQKALEGRLDREDVRDELLRIREKIDTGAHSREHADAVLRQEVSLNLQRMSQYQQAQLNDMAERQAATTTTFSGISWWRRWPFPWKSCRTPTRRG